MIITSYHPVYTFDSSREEKGGYHRFALRKTLEMNVLWYHYVRTFMPDEHILIVDQNGDYSIQEFLKHVNEPYEISSIYDFSYNSDVKLHIKQFDTKEQILKGVKRLYHFIYRFCYYNNVDFFFIENDCLVAKDLVSLCKNADFATNTIDLKHRVCDSYLSFISAARLREQDGLQPLDQYLDLIKTFDTFNEDPVWGNKDVSSIILNERGAYLKYCYGKVVTFNWDKIFHGETDEKLIKFLQDNPINNSYYGKFLGTVMAERAIEEIAEAEERL